MLVLQPWNRGHDRVYGSRRYHLGEQCRGRHWIGQNAYGITNIITSLTVDEALKVTVTAATAATPQGANMYVSATGVGNYKADLTLGQDGAANTITVKADAGTYTGAEPVAAWQQLPVSNHRAALLLSAATQLLMPVPRG
jgi:hypothetical protein